MKTSLFSISRWNLVLLGWITFRLTAGAGGPPASAPKGEPRDPIICERIGQSKVFEDPVVCVGEIAPAPHECEQLWLALEAAKTNQTHRRVESLEAFIFAHPSSPWIPSLRANLARYYRQTGRYTRALEHWEIAWQETRHFKGGSGKQIADFVLGHWTRLLSSLGRVDALTQILKEVGDRRASDLSSQKLFNQSRNNWVKMQTDPGESFQCGTFALWHASSALPGGMGAHGELLQLPSPKTGFSLSSLIDLSRKYQMPFIAVKRSAGGELIVPSVVHWRQEHYAAVMQRRGDYFHVLDPTFGGAVWMHQDVINEEASGYFLVPEHLKPANWHMVTKAEADAVFGRGMNGANPPPPPPPCPEEGQEACECKPPGSGGGSGNGGGTRGGGGGGCTVCALAHGMPVWEVEEPEISLWIRDIPMSYQPSAGPELAIKIYYHQRETRNTNANIFGFGPYWNGNLLTYLDATDTTGDPAMANYTATLYGSGGGERQYASTDTKPDYYRGTSLERILSGGNLVGFREVFPNGSENTYGLLVDVSSAPLKKRAFLTSRKSPQGVSTVFRYATNSNLVLLTNIVDADGLTNQIRYSSTFANQVSEIENPFGHVVRFSYETNGLLTNIVDVINLSSSFEYGWSNGVPLVIKLKTPYGDTTFDHKVTGDLFGYHQQTDNINRAIEVTEPTGGKHLWLYRDSSVTNWNGASFLPPNYSDTPSGVPVNVEESGHYYGLCDHYMYYRNTFYWSPLQYQRIDNGLFNLSAADYRLARIRNWLHSKQLGPTVGKTLNMERNFAIDGSTEGEKVWYGYYGKTAFHNWEGTNSKPNWIARRLPNGETRYSYREYNHLGQPTLEADTYTVGSSYEGRTNYLIYAANNIDLLYVTNQFGQTNATYGYDANHNPIAATNAVGEATTWVYDAAGRVLTNTLPTGLVITNSYDASGRLAKTVKVGMGWTNTFTWTNGMVRTKTDERGLTITNRYDGLGRLTNIAYPDNTSMSYTHTNLDIGEMKDRMGFITKFGYNAIRQKIWEIDPRGNTNSFGYCSCGALEYTTNALGQVTQFVYDYQGKLIQTIYPDGAVENRTYNSIGQLSGVYDGLGGITNTYNNQGLLAAVTNAFGRVREILYDFEDNATNAVDAKGVATVSEYDRLNRTVMREYPDAGKERFLYSALGLVGYTNQLGYVTRYFYDAMGRKTDETNANLDRVQFAYNPAGDLVKLTDGRNKVTSWRYDEFGRVTHKTNDSGSVIFSYKYDANGRLTNRWTPAKLDTGYTYDQNGNLTNVDYNVSADIRMAYDALNRLTNMVDAVGTNRFTFTSGGFLESEDGPWANDTVSYTYQNRWRSGLSVADPGNVPWTEEYLYDAGRRLRRVTSLAGQFGYQYSGASRLPQKLSLPSGAYITNIYDGVARLTSTKLKSSRDLTLNAHEYAYNVGNQRTTQTWADGNYVDYGYDPIGQLKTAFGKEAGGTTSRWQEQFGYRYDAAGNLLYRTNHSLLQSFEVDNLNELTNGTYSGRMTVAGTTTIPATSATVNTSNAFCYADATFASTNHAIASGTNTFTAIGSLSGQNGTNTVKPYLPSPVTFKYDANGSLTNDGLRSFTYDDENQLILILVSNKWKSEFSYDGNMRRRVRKEYSWGGFGWSLTNEVRYAYDGTLVIQERDGANTPTVCYTRGSDLSGTREGAGGIGGLLTYSKRQSLNYLHYFYHADGNGNVTMLLDGVQDVAAKYLYDPFGNGLSASGPLAEGNLYRFSSKEWHGNSGLISYLYRFCAPKFQRWLSQDPIGDYGSPAGEHPLGKAELLPEGPNLYGFVHNDPVTVFDRDGRVVPIVIGGGVAIGVAEAVAASFGLGLTACLASPPCAQAVRNALKDLLDKAAELCKPKPKQECPPCPPPPAGGSRLDNVPPSKPHWPCPGSHIHTWWYETNQEPWPSCKCHYNRREIVTCL